MLPILRVLPVGGVLLAILLLVLALSAPERIPAPLVPPMSPMRGPLLSLDDHPEWRQLLMQAAIRRADELSRLRELADTPAPPAVPTTKIANLPAELIDADPEPDNVTGSVVQPPPANIPVTIGEASSLELPVVLPEERPLPPIVTPKSIKSEHESRIRRVKHKRNARPAKPEPPPPFDLFKVMFGDLKGPAPRQAPFGANAAR